MLKVVYLDTYLWSSNLLSIRVSLGGIVKGAVRRTIACIVDRTWFVRVLVRSGTFDPFYYFKHPKHNYGPKSKCCYDG